MARINWNKLYLAHSPNLETLKANRQEYGHPRINIGYAYDYPSRDEPHFWSGCYSIEFQVTVNPKEEFEAFAYAGKLDCDLKYAAIAGKLIGKVYAKAEELAPSERCPYKRFLVGLRGLGYRQPTFSSNGGSEITGTC